MRQIDDETMRRFRAAIRPNTRAVVCTIASNVTGQILPYRRIAQLCRENGLCFIADGAQACGILPLSLEADGMHILCTAGHKGLYGITGTGILMTDCQFPIRPLMQGGTGSASRSPEQPDFLPDRLECGTLNVIGAASLRAGIGFVKSRTVEMLYRHESYLCDLFCQAMQELPEVRVYREAGVSYVPLSPLRWRMNRRKTGGVAQSGGLLLACRFALRTAGARKAWDSGWNAAVCAVGIQPGV